MAARTLVDTITKHKFSRGMIDEGGTPGIFITGVITMRSGVTTLTSGTTVVGSPIITSLSNTTNFRIGDYVNVDIGFSSATQNFKIIDKTAHTSSSSDDATLTLDTDATVAGTTATVSLPVQVLDISEDIPTLEGMMMSPDGGYVFDYDYTNKKIMIYVPKSSSGNALVEITALGLSGVTIPYIAWGY